MNEDEMLVWYSKQLNEMQVRMAKMILADIAKSPLVRFHPKYEELKEKYESFLE